MLNGGDVVLATEVYQNYWPAQALGGVADAFHILFEGQSIAGLFGAGRYLYHARFAYQIARY